MSDPTDNDTVVMSGVDSSDLFDPAKLAERYANIVRLERGFPAKWSYRIEHPSTGSEIGDIHFCEDGQGAYCRDNFPAPRMFWKSNIPIRTWADFESDMERMRLLLSNNRQ